MLVFRQFGAVQVPLILLQTLDITFHLSVCFCSIVKLGFFHNIIGDCAVVLSLLLGRAWVLATDSGRGDCVAGLHGGFLFRLENCVHRAVVQASH